MHLLKMLDPFRQCFKADWKVHLLRILRGFIGAIPLVGPFILEYLPNPRELNNPLTKEDIVTLHQFLNEIKLGNDQKHTWYSKEKESSLLIDEGRCEQRSYIYLRNNHLYITFLCPFDDVNYFFALEPNNLNVVVLKKTTTNIHLYVSKINPKEKVNWIAIGRSTLA